MTTHYMEEAAEADFVVILDSGKTVAEGTPNFLKEKYSSDSVKVYNDVEKETLKQRNLDFTEENGYINIKAKNIAEAKKIIIENADIFDDFEIIKGKMDDVFLNATGKALQGGDE